MDPPTLAELVTEVGISSALLNQKCSDTHIVSISNDLDWRGTAPHLGLSATDIEDIDCKRTEPEKRIETLRKWKKKFGFRAKIRMLLEKLLEAGNADHAETVCRLLKQQDEGTSNSRPAKIRKVIDSNDRGSQVATVDSAVELSTSSSETVSLLSELTPGSISRSEQEVLATRGQTAATSSFPYLNVGELSRRDTFALQSRLLRESDDIMSKFGDLIHHTINSISSSVRVKELRSRISSLGAYRPTRDQVPLLLNQLDEIERAEDVPSVFCILDKYYSFFNYGIIEKLIGWFGTPEDKERLETYTENFKRFCKRRTFECPPDIFGHTVDKGKTNLVMKVEESWDPGEGCSLENILRLCNSLADILEVEPETLYLCRIDKGCVELLFQVPSFVEEVLFPLSMKQERFLASLGVARLICGSYTCRFSQSPEALVSQTSAQAETQVKQKSSMHRPSLENLNLEHQQQMLFHRSLLKLHREQFHDGGPRLLRFVLVNNALRALQDHMAELSEESSPKSDALREHFFCNTFVKGGTLSPTLSMTPPTSVKLPRLEADLNWHKERAVKKKADEKLSYPTSSSTLEQLFPSSSLEGDPTTLSPIDFTKVDPSLYDFDTLTNRVLPPGPNTVLEDLTTPSPIDFTKVDPSLYDFDTPTNRTLPSEPSTPGVSRAATCSQQAIASAQSRDSDHHKSRLGRGVVSVAAPPPSKRIRQSSRTI